MCKSKYLNYISRLLQLLEKIEIQEEKWNYIQIVALLQKSENDSFN